MGRTPLRVGLLGARGLVGIELLALLAERRFPVAELRAFGSDESVGEEVDWFDDSIVVERADPGRVIGCELLFCAAPGALAALLPALREAPTRVIDVSGAFELDARVPLQLAGWSEPLADENVRWIAIPRGAVAGAGLALAPLAQRVPLERVTLVTLESASGLGRAGSEELSVQTIGLLNQMTGEPLASEIFPRPLAFDCLPQVGELLENGESSEETRLRHVLRRLLQRPELPVEVTRVRVPTFSGSLTCVHAQFGAELAPGDAVRIWRESAPAVRVLEADVLPTPRGSLGSPDVTVGRLRRGPGPAGSLSFAIALDDLRWGSALAAVLAAESWPALFGAAG